MKGLPLLATAAVALAVAVMIGLGIWQLRRADWKAGLVAQMQANPALPAIAWPAVPPKGDGLLFRRAEGFCTQVTGWRAIAGRNRADQTGWSHIAACRTGGAEGPGMQADMGWSADSKAPAWRGGKVSGLIVPDRRHRIRLVADTPASGLVASAPPSPRSMPNNHMGYALTWFFFAAAALVIYVLALRKRTRPISSDV